MSSLRLRLLAGAVIGISLALATAGLVLVQIFDTHVRQRYLKELDDHLLQLVANLDVDAAGGFTLKQELSEPEFRRPLSGHYWQVEREGVAVLRSRSLWDETLRLPPGLPGTGAARPSGIVGPFQQRLLVVERLIEMPRPDAGAVRIAVAGESGVVDLARRDFAGVVMLSLLVLGTLLAAASWLQIGAGLAPLQALRLRLQLLRSGATQRVEGDYPIEVVGLVTELNRLIEAQAREAERARSNAAKLGHGLKTPLAVLAAEARGLRDRGETAAADAITAEIDAMNAAVARGMASARAVGPRRAADAHTRIPAVAETLIAVMRKLPRGADLAWSVSFQPGLPAVPIDRRDAEDMLGNLLDNARKWAASRVEVGAHEEAGSLVVIVDDDGPGIPPGRIVEVLRDGARLDRTVPGSGVGLSIVADLSELNGGRLALLQSPAGGLRAELRLPLTTGSKA